MSRHHERNEKICLNCGSQLRGRFCHQCGQENLEPKESIGHLFSHFFNDITHFDGKFFTTLKDLLIKPGFLSQEYISGRRANYLNPVRMYLLTSAIFFLLFFSFLHNEKDSVIAMNINGKSLSNVESMDSATFAKFTAAINESDHKPGIPMTRQGFKLYMDSITKIASPALFTTRRYRSREEYDSMLKTGVVKDNWFKRHLQYKGIELRKKYGDNKAALGNALNDTFYHFLPQMLIISLPFLALILKLIYIRRKQFYYVSHLIFSVHLYIFIFIDILVILSLQNANSYAHSGVISFITGLLYLSIFIYEYLSLKKFYQQGWGKTFLKFLLIDILYVIVIAILLVVFLFFSFLKI